MRIQTEIGLLGNTFTGLSGKTKVDFGHGDAQYITFLNVLTHPTIDPTIFERVNVKPNEKQNLCKKGDLFFNTSSETPEEVGMCSCLNVNVPRLYLNSFCFGFRLKEDASADSQYLAYFFRGKEGRQIMTMLAQGATRYNLSKENFMRTSIELPPKPEQERIAAALTSIDSLIANLERTIQKKKNIREGAMEELLSGKRRLPGFSCEWVEKEIGVICHQMRRGSMLKSEDFIAGNIPVIAAGTEPAGYHNVANRPPMTISVSSSGANAGYIQFHPYPIFAGDCFTISGSEEYDVQFIYYLLKNKQKEIFKLQTGGAQPHVHPKDLAPFVIPYTFDIHEQHAIADTLTALDDEIALLQAECDKYLQIRSGMMDDLLTGKIRLQ